MSPRPYRSAARAEAVAETRGRLVAAAAELLGAEPYRPFSLEAVAKTAGVTRLTVYNQFGGRRGLLEAVFDAAAARGGMERLAEAAANPDPRAAIALVIAQFCAFWSAGEQAHLRLHAARAADPDLDLALHERNERRRRLFAAILGRMAARGEIEPGSVADLADVLHALTSVHVFADLAPGRGAAAVEALIAALAEDALARVARA
jgi:AcrR family transcriptional regulator